jgi:RNA polymerase sigma-70 factor (ECF subfamily)
MFFQRYQPLILAWCRRRGLHEDDAEDVGSRVLEKLFRAFREGKYDSRRRFRSWLKTVVDHAVSDWLRARARHPGDRGVGASDHQEILNNLTAPDASAELVEELDRSLDRERRLVQQAVAQVQREYDPQSQTWRAFEELALKGRPAAEVAAELGMSTPAVRMARLRVVAKLRGALAAPRPPGPETPESKP